MKTTPRQGILPPQVARRLPVATIDARDEYSSVAMGDGSLENTTCDSLIFEQVRLRRINFIRAHVTRFRVSDAHLDSCDLSAVSWEQAHVKRTEFSGCRMWGANLYKAHIEDARFDECNAENAVFTGAVFRAVRFEGCKLVNVTFNETVLSGVVFRRCDLRGADLRDAKLVMTDFRTCIIDGLRINATDLRGAIIELAQTVDVARLLGITVQDSESSTDLN